MKKLTALAGLCLPLFLLLLFGCAKRDALPLPPPPANLATALQVIQTTPANVATEAALYDTLSANFNFHLDTTAYEISFFLRDEADDLPGTISIADSTVSFFPINELTPSQRYTATVVLQAKKGGATIVNHSWSFLTKAADEYEMTLRSEHVTNGNRDGNRCMQIGDYLYSFGGWKDPPLDSYNDVYRSSGDLTEWTRLPDAPWHGRHIFGIAKIQDSTYVVGGDPFYPDFDVWRTTDGITWKRLAHNLLGNRVLYGCTEHKGYIYVVGGQGYSDVWRSRNGKDWEPVADNVPFLKNENMAGSLSSFRGRLWMVCGGGDGWGGGAPRKEVWSSTDGREWRREKDFPGTERYYTDVCVWDNKLWVVGGYNYTEGNTRSIWYMKPDGSWKQFETPAGYIGRHASGLGVYNNQLVIVCGNYVNDCWVVKKLK